MCDTWSHPVERVKVFALGLEPRPQGVLASAVGGRTVARNVGRHREIPRRRASATGSFPDFYPTISEDFSAVVAADDGESTALTLWDTAGQEDYDHYRPRAYPGTDVFLVCFSVVAPSSFDSVRGKWHAELARHCPDVPRLLVGTKSDLRSDADTLAQLAGQHQQPVSAEQGDALAEEIGACKYVECSARTQNGLHNVFNEVVRARPPSSKSASRSTSNEKGKGKCCLS